MDNQQILSQIKSEWEIEAQKQGWDKNDVKLYGMWLQEQLINERMEKWNPCNQKD